jgi:hypothetical protein
MAWAATGVMLLAILANVRKAADVMIGLGRPGGLAQYWDAFAAAIAMEAGFALFAFFMAREIKGERRYMHLLVAGTVIMAMFSAVANIAYYTKYSPAAVGTWEWGQSVVLGLSAPSVAIMTAVLAGVVAGMRELAGKEEAAGAVVERQHELLVAKELTAQVRAEARAAKALSATGATGIAGSSGKVAGSAGNGRMTMAKLLEIHPEAAGWTGKRISEVAGVSPRTGRYWAEKMRREAVE